VGKNLLGLRFCWRRGWAAWLARPLTSLHLVLGVFAVLTLFGLAMVLSASNVEAYAQEGSSYSVFIRHALFCLVGLVLFWVGLRIPPRRLRVFAPLTLAVSVLLLVGVLIPGIGTSIAGARKWYVSGGLSVQPSELAKVALVLWGAQVLVARRRVVHLWRGALLPLVPVGLLICALVVLQPDLGTTVSLVVILIALLFFAGASLPLLAALTAGAVGGAVILGITSGYRQSRITSFLDSGATDPLGAAYQARQALLSLADGGLFGAGLGQGRAKWSYLPNAHNDFIFAILGEELGLVGTLAVLLLFAALAYTGLRIATRTPDPWLKVVAATLTTWLVAQAAINIGYVIGLLPVTGIPLPLISSGGTSLVVTMFVFGLLANAARHETEASVALRRDPPSQLTRLLAIPPPQAPGAAAKLTQR
jgi:cell division protein FtsW